MEDEICPYATFHPLGFREEMDPTKAMNFQTFPHQNGHTPVPGHAGTMLPPGHPGHVHSRSGSQSMPRANRYQRKNSQVHLASPDDVCPRWRQVPLSDCKLHRLELIYDIANSIVKH